MAGNPRDAGRCRSPRVLDHAHRDHLGIGRRFRANLSGLANYRRMAGRTFAGLRMEVQAEPENREPTSVRPFTGEEFGSYRDTTSCRLTTRSATVRWEEFDARFSRTSGYFGLPAGQNSGEVDQR